MDGAKDVPEQLDWLQLKGDIGSVEIIHETAWEKFQRKTKENPFVPIGGLVTLGFLFVGLESFRKGQSKKSQLMMRGRVLAQAFTVAALVGGIFYSSMMKNSAAKKLQVPTNSLK